MVSSLQKFTVLDIAPSNTVWAEVVDYETFHLEIHSVRQAVFVSEQQIPAAFERDSHDPVSQHVLAWYGDNFIGTGRLTPTGQIGRVAVFQDFRRRGVGRCIVETLLGVARQKRYHQVMLAAQHHAVPFYEKLGFHSEACFFEELGIQHIMMRKHLV